MAIFNVDKSQRKAAKVAGILYLFTILTANLTEFYVRRQMMVPGDAVRTAGNIAAHEQLFRIGIAGDLLMFAGNIGLVVALYVILKPVNKNMALLAVFWWLVECSIAAATVGTDFAAVLSLTGSNSVPALNTEHIQALAQLLISLDAGGNRAAALFFGLGSTLFCYLWLSRVIFRGCWPQAESLLRWCRHSYLCPPLSSRPWPMYRFGALELESRSLSLKSLLACGC